MCSRGSAFGRAIVHELYFKGSEFSLLSFEQYNLFSGDHRGPDPVLLQVLEEVQQRN